jgi:hypothetical protein
MKVTSPFVFYQAVLLVQLASYVTGESFFSSMVSSFLSSGATTDSASTFGLRKLSFVHPVSTDDDDSADLIGSTTNVAASTGHGGVSINAYDTNDDDYVPPTTTTKNATKANNTETSSTTSTTTTTTTTTANSTATSNSTDSANTTGTSNTTTTSNTTEANTTDAPAATEVPTLGVYDLISLLDDDAIHNATAIIPAEKEQPRDWAGYVIVIFLFAAVILFGATAIKQRRKRRTYSEVPTSLVV